MMVADLRACLYGVLERQMTTYSQSSPLLQQKIINKKGIIWHLSSF